VTATAPDLALRRLREDDRWTLFDWRDSERVRAVSLDSAPLQREGHSAWFDRTLVARRDEVLVVEWQGRSVGVVQLEALRRDQRISSWGCHLGETDVPPGLGAALPLLGLGYGFETFGLRRMHAQVLGHNTGMRSIHRRLGVPEEGVLRNHLLRPDGSEIDVHLYGVLREEWPDLRDRGLALFPSSLAPSVARACRGTVTD
jgi:RimJ/RimL family protein N-acetyltransferase